MLNKLRLSGNQLKILALVTMTLDHVGKFLFPEVLWLQILGRLAFPVFAYMIAEGCQYTKNRRKHLLSVGAVALLCQVVYYVAMGSLYMCIMVTFLISIMLIYCLEGFGTTFLRNVQGVVAIVLAAFVCLYLPRLMPETDFYIDYGFFGVFLPVAVYYARGRLQKMVAACFMLILLGLQMGGIQWYCLLGLIPLMLYSGARGKWNLKYLFYIYYPVHLAVIYGIGLLLL